MNGVGVPELLKYYLANESVPQSHREDVELRLFQDRCNSLFSRDYLIELLDNDLCPTYPLQIVLLEGFKTSKDVGSEKRIHEIKAQMNVSKDCRCRQRFPVLVIRVEGKNICRSAGLSEKVEMYFRKAKGSTLKDIIKNKGINASKRDSRQVDIIWLSTLKIKYIIDMMNETKRSLFGVVPLCSGEVASSYYSNFKVNAMPFPGVDTYKSFKENRDANEPLPFARYRPESKDQAELILTDEESYPFVKWEEYRRWDIVLLTQNYLKYIFHLLRTGKSDDGILIHCISGWDRTPLMIGVLRILLWAEGAAHKSLDAEQILFLVIGYDWLLFGHQLLSRLKKENSQIMYFAFWVLQYLTDDEFSLHYEDSRVRPKKPRHKIHSSGSANSSYADFNSEYKDSNSSPTPAAHNRLSNSAPNSPHNSMTNFNVLNSSSNTNSNTSGSKGFWQISSSIKRAFSSGGDNEKKEKNPPTSKDTTTQPSPDSNLSATATSDSNVMVDINEGRSSVLDDVYSMLSAKNDSDNEQSTSMSSHGSEQSIPIIPSSSSSSEVLTTFKNPFLEDIHEASGNEDDFAKRSSDDIKKSPFDAFDSSTTTTTSSSSSQQPPELPEFNPTKIRFHTPKQPSTDKNTSNPTSPTSSTPSTTSTSTSNQTTPFSPPLFKKKNSNKTNRYARTIDWRPQNQVNGGNDSESLSDMMESMKIEPPTEEEKDQRRQLRKQRILSVWEMFESMYLKEIQNSNY
eukprot:TRINITY_DN1565_c2_g2_i5.p2 TRINITY_DN1565_c2_g2~~TRINITY_DN1565_c2_g2_i5.p2  ORF type:complete len:738 (-),score=171.49 TRINITY_DN1565_c2_g2_i5:224-2437(-)